MRLGSIASITFRRVKVAGAAVSDPTTNRKVMQIKNERREYIRP